MGEQPHVVGAGVDKCSIGIVYSHEPLEHELPWVDVGALISWAHSVKDEEFASVSGGRKSTYKRFPAPSALTRVKQPLASGNSLRCLYGGHKGTYRAWVGMNPTLSHLGEINFHLLNMFEQGFETLRRHGAMTAFEFFVDVDHARFDDYLYIDTALRSAHQGYVPKGTMYLGAKRGRRRVKAYDKQKQLASVKAIFLDSPRLRIECTLLGGAHRIKDICSVPNPFATLHVIEKNEMAKVACPAAKTFQQLVSWGMSSQKAYQCLSATQKAEMSAVMQYARPAWWNAPVAWQRILESLGWVDTLSVAGITGEYLPLGAAAYASESAVTTPALNS